MLIIVVLLVGLAGGMAWWVFGDNWWSHSSSEEIETTNPGVNKDKKSTQLKLELVGISGSLLNDERSLLETTCQAYYASKLQQTQNVSCEIVSRRRLQAAANFVSVTMAISADWQQDGFAVLVQVTLANSYREWIQRLKDESEFFAPLERINGSTVEEKSSSTSSPSIALTGGPTASPTSVSTGGGAALILDNPVMPNWYDNLKDYTAYSNIQQCLYEQNSPPKSGDNCGLLSKTCFFETQTCANGQEFPTKACRCQNGIWICSDFICPGDTEKCKEVYGCLDPSKCLKKPVSPECAAVESGAPFEYPASFACAFMIVTEHCGKCVKSGEGVCGHETGFAGLLSQPTCEAVMASLLGCKG